MIISNESKNFKDPKESDDPQLFDDPSRCYSMIPSYSLIPSHSMIPSYSMIIGSMDFDNRKVYGDTFISDGLVSIALHCLMPIYRLECYCKRQLQI